MIVLYQIVESVSFGVMQLERNCPAFPLPAELASFEVTYIIWMALWHQFSKMQQYISKLMACWSAWWRIHAATSFSGSFNHKLSSPEADHRPHSRKNFMEFLLCGIVWNVAYKYTPGSRIRVPTTSRHACFQGGSGLMSSESVVKPTPKVSQKSICFYST